MQRDVLGALLLWQKGIPVGFWVPVLLLVIYGAEAKLSHYLRPVRHPAQSWLLQLY